MSKPTLHYQVLVAHMFPDHGGYYLAQILDLDCQAVGASPSEAIEAARAQALRQLQKFEGSTRTPPERRHLSLAGVDLPAPRSRLAT